MGFRAECPGGWLGNRSVDGVTAGWDCGTAGFGWSEPLFECPMPGIIHDACGVQRLPNGNTVIAAYAAKSGAKLMEVNRDKKVVWSYDGPHRVHHFQVLTTNGEPLPGMAMK